MTQTDIDASYRAWYRRTWPKHVLAAPVPVYAAEPSSHQLTTIDMITREALRLFRNTSCFMRTVEAGPDFRGWEDYNHRHSLDTE